jgi:hypothetical protein
MYNPEKQATEKQATEKQATEKQATLGTQDTGRSIIRKQT